MLFLKRELTVGLMVNPSLSGLIIVPLSGLFFLISPMAPNHFHLLGVTPLYLQITGIRTGTGRDAVIGHHLISLLLFRLRLHMPIHAHFDGVVDPNLRLLVHGMISKLNAPKFHGTRFFGSSVTFYKYILSIGLYL